MTLETTAAAPPSPGPQLAAQPAQPSATPRFVFLDGLRGIASLLVVVTHFYSTGFLHPQLRRVVPNFIDYTIVHWLYGVPVFFVLSGFVIAYSQRNIKITRGFLGNFALRRSLRLDPLYWTAITLTLIDNRVTRSFMLHPWPAYPLRTILCNMVYLQGILNSPIIVGPSWTLCFEVQYYLTLTILVGIAQALPYSKTSLWGWKSATLIPLFVPLGIISVYVSYRTHSLAYVPQSWWMFFLGVMVWWTVSGMVAAPWLFAYMLLILAYFCAAHTGYGIVSLLTGIAIYIAAKTGGLTTWLRWRPLQFFGAISYSMYLTHSLFNPLEMVGKRLFPNSTPGAWLTVSVAFALSVATAYALYRLIERPSLALANRFKPRRVEKFFPKSPGLVITQPISAT